MPKDCIFKARLFNAFNNWAFTERPFNEMAIVKKTASIAVESVSMRCVGILACVPQNSMLLQQS